MSEVGVKKVIARMIADPNFKAAVHQDAAKAVADAGYHLDQNEIAAVAKLKPNDLKVNIGKLGGQVGVWEVSSVKS